jgi:hypothetical protein
MKNKVIKYWPISPENGNLLYWDGEQWVVLPNGNTGDVLTTHSTISGPTWESLPEPIQPSSSSSILGSSSSSSSSSIVPEPPPNIPSVPFEQPIGLTTQTNTTAREEVHLVLQPKGATSTKDREGNEYENVKNPFAAPWNWDDNNSGNEVIYFAFEDPLTNKHIGVSYAQTRYLTFGYYISEINVVVKEISGENSGYTTLSGGPKQYTIEGDGFINVNCNSLGNVSGSILTSNSSSSDISFSLPPPDEFYPLIPDPPNKLTIDIPLFTLEISQIPGGGFNAYSMNLVPKSTYLQESIYAGGKIGGLWYLIMEKIRDYGDNGGYVSEAGVPVATLNSSSSNVRIGCWGWYGLESSSSSSVPFGVPPHFIPINRISDDFNIDIDDFIGENTRVTLEDTANNAENYVNSISFFDANVIATIWNMMQDTNNKGYWELTWCDPSLRIEGQLPCCLYGRPVPGMILTVTGGSGSITWGKDLAGNDITWNLPADSGRSFRSCPTSYFRDRTYRTNSTSFHPTGVPAWFDVQDWFGAGLRMMSAYLGKDLYSSFFRYRSQNLVYLEIQGKWDEVGFINFQGSPSRPIGLGPGTAPRVYQSGLLMLFTGTTPTTSFGFNFGPKGLLVSTPFYGSVGLTNQVLLEDFTYSNGGITYRAKMDNGWGTFGQVGWDT